MDRREFFFLTRRGPRTLEVSCEELYMRFLDSRTEQRVESFLEEIREQLGRASRIRFLQAGWLRHGELQAQLEPILRAARQRGCVIEYDGR